jgi:hypothetical protein
MMMTNVKAHWNIIYSSWNFLIKIILLILLLARLVAPTELTTLIFLYRSLQGL